MSDIHKRTREAAAIFGADLARARIENEELRNALRGLYGLCKLLYVGADSAEEIKRHLATNHRSIEAARVLGVDRLDAPPPAWPVRPRVGE
jgi:hypothetical protein